MLEGNRTETLSRRCLIRGDKGAEGGGRVAVKDAQKILVLVCWNQMILLFRHPVTFDLTICGRANIDKLVK
jgi:hypothetical protein